MKCLHPVRVNTPLGERLLPCGKCEACLLRASSFSTLTCQIEKQHNRFMYFSTLTYSNAYVPRVKMLDNWSDKYPYVTLQFITDRLSNYNDKFKYHCDIEQVKKLRHIIYKRSSTPGFLTFCSYEDIQKFMKRLRKHTDKYEKIRYYVVPDYGPQTFRAHWHLLLFFNSEKLAQVIREYICKAWNFGFVNSSAATSGKSIAYTSGYCNSSTVLPDVYKTPKLKVCQHHSVYFGTKDFDLAHKEIFFNPTDNMYFRYALDGKSCDITPWRSCQLRLFPKPVGFHEKSYEEIKYSYNIYRYALQIFGDYPITTLADLIVNSDMFSNPITAYFFNRYACCSYDNLKHTLDYEKFVGRVARYLYISKRFQQIIDRFQISVDIGIQFIRNWYDIQSQITLKRWYTDQQNDAKNGILSQTISRYYDDVFPMVSAQMGNNTVIFEDTPIYQYELYQAHKKILDKIKHRKLNEANGYLVAFDFSDYKPNYKFLKILKYA